MPPGDYHGEQDQRPERGGPGDELQRTDQQKHTKSDKEKWKRVRADACESAEPIGQPLAQSAAVAGPSQADQRDGSGEQQNDAYYVVK